MFKLSKQQEDFLKICWSMKVVNIVPQAAKLGIPEAEVRKYLATKGLAIDQGGFVFQGKAKDQPERKKGMIKEKGMAKKTQQYGLKPESPYPTSTDKCGCVRIVNEHVIDFCSRHALNEIIYALKSLDLHTGE